MLIVVLLALRFLHFGPLIDAPHDWRQCDTAHYITDFYQNGIDLFYPNVCWMGGYGTVVLECPLPEALIALVFGISGESIPLARLIFLSLFAGAVYFFYKIAVLLFTPSVARLATLVYLLMPLSLYYSRAIHIDFSVVMLGHAMFYYFLLAIQNRQTHYLILSALLAVPALLIKAPYIFYLAVPMLAYSLNQKEFRWLLGRAWFYLPAIVLFVFWQQHAYSVNGAAPDWDYILHYRKFNQSWYWYFGTLEQRLAFGSWWQLGDRGVMDVAGPGGILFFLAGLFALAKARNISVLLAWLAGTILYLLIFFNLNVVHNYYQIPMLAPVAVIVALGLQFLTHPKSWVLPALLGVMAILNVGYSEIAYFQINKTEHQIGHLLESNTKPDDLIIITFDRYDCRNPKLLYRARRKGWSVEELAVNAITIGRLWREEGANCWAYIGQAAPHDKVGLLVNEIDEPSTFLLNDSLRLFLYQLPNR